MKKLLFSAVALATLLFAGSCQREGIYGLNGGNIVSYTVEAPGKVQTKAIADGLNVDQLIYEVWLTPTLGDLSNGATKLFQANTGMSVEDGVNKATITLDLVRDQKYTVLFWAQVDDADAYLTGELTEVTYAKDSYDANDESLAAFYAVAYINDSKHVTKEGESTTGKVSLRRPFAQLNLGTLNTATAYSVTLKNSQVVLSNVNTTFNVATSEASDPEKFTFNMAAVPSNPAILEVNNATYEYAGMNYIFAGSNITVEYDIETSLNNSTNLVTVNNIVENVPIKENHRTNIIGNLLTSNVDYEIVVDEKFATNQNPEDMEVYADGIVKNIYGDYEVTTANGLAYAINNLFDESGNFYLTSELYEMSGFAVNPPTAPAGVVLNIYGQIPAVTRATVVGGATITGLSSGLIDLVEGDAVVTIENINVVGEGLTLINKNEGTVVLSDVNVEGTGSTLIDTNEGSATFTNSFVDGKLDNLIGENTGDSDIISNVETFEEFTAALATSATTIRLVADITYDKSYDLKKNVTIDLNEHYFEISNPSLMLNIHSVATVKNGTIKGKVYARKNSDITFDGVNFGGSINGGGSIEGLLQIQAACNVYAKACKFNATNSNTTKSRPLSIEGRSSGSIKFENCEFKSNTNQNQVYVNTLSGTATLDFTNCNFNKTPNIMLAASCPFTSLTMSGTTKLSSVTLEINRAKTAVSEDDLAYLRTMISNNSFSSVRVFYSGGSSEYIK